MSFSTISAILRGRWLLDTNWTQAHLPLVFKMLKGDQVDLGNQKDKSTNASKKDTYAGTAYGVSFYTDLSKLPSESIAVVSITGPLMKQGDMCSWGMVDYTALINRLGANGNVAGIILDIDSPGGQADGTAMTADSITNAKQRKPVISVIQDGMAASAGYWIASAADELYVTQGTDMVGSVGVYTTIADWNAHYQDHFKLPVKEIYAPQSTDKNKDYREALAGNDELVKSDLKVLADQFINTVKRNRGARIQSNDWTTGKMFYANEAKKNGLIDGVRSFDQVIKRMNDLIKN